MLKPALIKYIGRATIAAALAVLANTSNADEFIDVVTTPFGEFSGIEYVRLSGMFEGKTEKGEFRMPFEVVTPAAPLLGETTLLVEPPHFFFGTTGRDDVLGHDLIFGRGLRYATVGFGNNGFNVLNPFAPSLVLAGEPAVPLPFPAPPDQIIIDEEIIAQFVEALETDQSMAQKLGLIDRRYTYGISQTGGVVLELLLGPDGEGLFDLSLVHLSLWGFQNGPPGVFDFVPHGNADPVAFDPPAGVGRVMFVNSEGDTFLSDAEFYQCAADLPDYRLYEVSGAAHLPTPGNPLNHNAIMRAIFVRGDEWVGQGIMPPDSWLMTRDPASVVDPGCGEPTGILRDADDNALGGVQLPDFHVGRATYIASDPRVPFPIPGLVGSTIDLSCAVDENGVPRFVNHGDYVNAVADQARVLRYEGFLLESDAEDLIEMAGEASVGKPGNCD